jgi:hypothetical protein
MIEERVAEREQPGYSRRGSLHSFREPLDPELPHVAAGCYTVWDDDGRYLYAGMAGRSLTAERIRLATHDPKASVSGLRDRLRAHRAGRRSGDQFAVYVFDRLVLGRLTSDEIASAVNGTRRLDEDVRDFIGAHLSYRWVATVDGTEAFALEHTLVTEGLGGSLPYLKPRRPDES